MAQSDVSIDYITPSGGASGSVAEKLLAHNFDVRALRPYTGPDGRSYITTNDRWGKPQPQLVSNNPATLRFQDWRLIDEQLIKVSLPRLKAVADIRAAGLTYTMPGGMAKTVLSHERQSDVSPAHISMDGRVRGETDRPQYDILNLPLPIISKDFQFGAREVMASRMGYSPLDLSMGELSARKVMEEAEKLFLGTAAAGYQYGGGNVYGLTNFPYRMTKAMTLPTALGWTPQTTINEVIAMRTQSQGAYHFGPWNLYTSLDWDQYLDIDYKSTYGETTLRTRLQKINGISKVETLDFLPSMTMVLLQMSSDVVQEVIGMDMTTVQWQSGDGLQLNYKIICILVPRFRADQNNRTGVVHGVAA